MGVPAFFRYLSRKYPSVIVDCAEQRPVNVDGTSIPVNAAEPNPNGVEFDNLYLDMNGIIHPCTHPEDKPAPKNEDEMMQAIFECIDRLFSIVRPRKILYMAIDGVAPRAKMNQQRSRRFRASKESAEKITEVARIRSELAVKGAYLPPEKPKEDHFDSNCITPGTPFMARLSACLHYYIHDRLNNDPGWKGIKVILSDANVPGEGEHKIMDFIRKQRVHPDYNPNTQHVLCGADADLIMLGLATHEPNFTIIREEFKPNKPKPCDICGQLGHEMKDCIGAEQSAQPTENTFGEECKYIFVRLNVLREYLEKELQMPNLPFKYDFERAVDDWVFMCFFVGNDFLPHLPSLEIREGAIDRLVNLYKKAVYKTGGFLTDSGDVNLDRVQMIMSDLGNVEDEIFKQRQQNELRFKQREKNNKKRCTEAVSYSQPKFITTGAFTPNALGRNIAPKPVQNARHEAYMMRMQQNFSTSSTNRALEKVNPVTGLEKLLVPENSSGKGQKRKHEEVEKEEEEDDQAHDEVRLWEDGFKDRYYESKFDASPDDLAFRNNVALQYVRGLCWVLRYYYQGCASWKWYFPYHYAPFASDFVNITGLSTQFEKGTVPFKPLEQLMGVFPAASSRHVPEPFAKLMSDPTSTIIDFYPEDFKIDLNGKKFAWQGVALLPFVNEQRLFKALEPYYDCLTEAEKKRNIRGDDRLYIGPGNSKYEFIKNLYLNKTEQEVSILIDGMRGTVLLSDDCVREGATLPSPINTEPIRNNRILCVRFKDPQYGSDFIFPARRLKGAIEPAKVLKPQDFDKMNRNGNQWRPQIGFVKSTTKASLDIAGHRMVQHHGSYHKVPPPQAAQNSYNSYKSYNTGYQPRPNQGHFNQPQRGFNNRNSEYRPQHRAEPFAFGGYAPDSRMIPQNSYYPPMMQVPRQIPPRNNYQSGRQYPNNNQNYRSQPYNRNQNQQNYQRRDRRN